MADRAPNRAVRARTRAGRLARLDAWLCLRETALLAVDSTLVDVGFGETGVTTQEWAQAAWAINPRHAVCGLEREPARVERARADAPADARLSFHVGGFADVVSHGPAAVIRVMNVLRSYAPEESGAVWPLLQRALEEGGVVLEGTTSPAGDRGTAQVLRLRGGVLVREALLFFTSAEHGFAPWMFRDWLPSEFRRAVRPGTELHAFFERWHGAWEQTRAGHASAEALVASAGPLEGELQLEAGLLRWNCGERLPLSVG